MMKHVRKKAYNYWIQWARNRVQVNNPQTVNSKNIYILPSKFGWIYSVLVLSLFTGAINYQISTIFLMTFLLAVIGLISAWEACGNMNHLSIKLINIEDAQQNKPAKLTLLIQSPQKTRFGFDCYINKQCKIHIEEVSTEGTQVFLPITTSARGFFFTSSNCPYKLLSFWHFYSMELCLF